MIEQKSLFLFIPLMNAMKEKKTRRLAAVMFTDIVGYTALMQGNEEHAAIVREKHRNIFEEQHKLHHGEIIQYYGDGTLSIFTSAIEAANCAIEIQRLLKQGDPVPVRMGLHMGDIVFDNTEVYGDGVNFASRIESMGIPGAVLLSGKLNDELNNHPGISTVSLGHFELKNIQKPVEVFAVANQGINVPKKDDLKGKQKATNKTIAVLPFVNLSSDAENEYFSDGITEEIINALAKIESLKVTSRTSSFFFKNKNIPIKEIGKELKVSIILEGSVRRAGNMVRITAQLIEAEQDFHFWSETWDRKLENIFEIQDEISLLIAEKLREQFGHFEIQEHLVKKQTDIFNAYDYFLKARYHHNKWNPDDMQIAISLYKQALDIDPKHAESYAGLADSYSFMGTTGFMPYEETWGETIRLNEKARLLNDQLPDVYYQLANIAFFIKCDYRESFSLVQKALELNPNYVEAQHYISYLYIIAGEKEKSLHHLEISMGIDPLSQATDFYKAYYHYMLEDFDEALVLLDKCLEANPKNIPAFTVKAYCLLKMQLLDEVLEFFNKIPPSVVVKGDELGIKTLVYAHKKDSTKAEKYFNELKEAAKHPEGFRANSYLFLYYASTSRFDEAFEWVEQAIANKWSLLMIHYIDPLANPIKQDPRYEKYHQILFGTEIRKTQTSTKKELLDAQSAKNYAEKLLLFMDKHKPYLDPNLSLRALAGQIEIHPNQLSWLLNEHIGKSFSEFVNSYRVEEFKRNAKDPQKAHITLIGLAYESGFNSKTVFNTSFKNETGLTPKQYLNNGE